MRARFPSADAPMRTVLRILLAQLDKAVAGLKRPISLIIRFMKCGRI